MQSPWLSICIPVYNVRQYLEACIESVLSQPLQGVEVLLLDDCSTDGSATVAEQFASQYSANLRLLRHPRNQGISAVRNSLLDAATGTYVWFLDSDDILMPGAIKGLAETVERHRPDLVLCDFYDMRDKVRLKHRLRREHHRRTFPGPANTLLHDRNALWDGLLRQGHMHVWSKIARRELWGTDLRFPVGRTFEDMAVAPFLALRARSYVYVDRIWIGYRKRPGSIVASQSEGKLDDMQAATASLPALTANLTPALSATGRFYASWMAAKNFIAAARFDVSQGKNLRLAQRLAVFERSCLIPPRDVVAGCVRRGWLWRALKLSYWLRRSRNHSLRP